MEKIQSFLDSHVLRNLASRCCQGSLDCFRSPCQKMVLLESYMTFSSKSLLRSFCGERECYFKGLTFNAFISCMSAICIIKHIRNKREKSSLETQGSLESLGTKDGGDIACLSGDNNHFQYFVQQMHSCLDHRSGKYWFFRNKSF